MALIKEKIDNELHITIDGRIDAATSGPLQEELVELIRDVNNDICLEFGSVQYISSMGLRVLLVAAKQLRAKGLSMRINNASTSVMQVLKLSGFDTFIRLG